ncbi:MAG: hypothetical protein IPM35_38815 [Myxococcales bacterium]|nr:hypothetical protein [Myxococcales bacterium]
MTERPKISPVITCPHCGADNAQRMSYALAQVVGIAAVVLLSFVAVAPVLGTNLMLLVGFALYLVFDFVWWTRVTRLELI